MPLMSTKGVYGLMAMYELAQNNTNTPIQIKEISKKANIPQNYLEQLLIKLKKATLLESVRGAKGGYKLAKKPEDIKIIDILVALEGDLKIIDTKINNPILNIFFNDTKESMKELFDLSLDRLNEYKEKYNEYLHYSI